MYPTIFTKMYGGDPKDGQGNPEMPRRKIFGKLITLVIGLIIFCAAGYGFYSLQKQIDTLNSEIGAESQLFQYINVCIQVSDCPSISTLNAQLEALASSTKK